MKNTIVRYVALILGAAMLFTLCACTPAQGGNDPAPVVDEVADPDPWTAYSNLVYASVSDSQKLDLLVPAEGEGPFPVVFLLHGGGFAFGSKTMSCVKDMYYLTEHGYAVVGIDYRLSNEALFPGAVADVKAAIRYVRANAAQYNLDPEKFAIWGESAGAYLALMAAVTSDEDLNGDVADNLDVSSSVSALVTFYAPVRFFEMDSDFESIGVTAEDRTSPIGAATTADPESFESKFMGKSVAELTDDEKALCDPYTYIAKNLSAESNLTALIQHGNADINVPYVQGEKLAAELGNAIGSDRVYLQILDGAKHQDSAFYTESNLAIVLDFLNRAFK